MSVESARSRLPVVPDWFAHERVADDLVRVYEPHAHPFVRGNIWWLRGDDRDLVVDAGLGVARLRTCVPAMFEREPLLVLTHAHLDHAGSAYEFDEVAAHAAEPVDGGVSLEGARLAELLGLDAELPRLLIDAVPEPDYDPSAYAVRAFAVTRTLADGDRIDIGERSLTVVHLPGHTAGGIGLFDEHDGSLFSGDVVYDGALLDTIDGADPAAYRGSMRRIRELDVRVVRPGHDPGFGRTRLRRLVDSYLAGRTA